MNLKRILDEIHQLEKFDFLGRIAHQTGFPKNIVKKGIEDGLLLVNGIKYLTPNIPIGPGTIVKFQNKQIEVESNLIQTRFDRAVNKFLKQSSSRTIKDLSSEQKLSFLALLLEYFSRYSYKVDELQSSEHNTSVFLWLEEYVRLPFHNTSELKTLKKKDLIDKLQALKEASYTNFETIIRSTTNKLYGSPDKMINDFRHFFKEQSFRAFIQPLIDVNVDLMLIIERIIKVHAEIIEAGSQNDKIQKRSAALEAYSAMRTNYFNNKDERFSRGFNRIINFYEAECNLALGFKDTGKSEIRIIPEIRTYNFNDLPILVNAIVENKGTGIAKKIKILANEGSVTFVNQEIVDILPPGEKRKVKFKIDNLTPSETVVFDFRISWENEFKEESDFHVSQFTIARQDENLPWEELKRSNPYSTRIVEDPAKLFGRDQLINDLKWNIEKNIFINSFILFGQKRVGKSSIVRTLDTIYKDNPTVTFVYKSIGGLKDTDPYLTFQKIGESLAAKILNECRGKLKPGDFAQLTEKQIFGGSLSPLIDLLEQIHEFEGNLRFIIVLDEFDELNKEFFESGDLGKTFALNIGKGLSELPYVGVILVGSENMISKTKQGMRLNNFDPKKVDTFDKKNEYPDYCKIITEPCKTCLTFAPEVLDQLFDWTNGNPYFTNVLADKLFKDAYDRKISFVDSEYSNSVIQRQITLMSNGDFEHFWDDGLSEESVNYEKILDRRKRILTSFAEAKKEKKNCTLSDIKRKFKFPKKFTITEDQIEDSVKEFKQRGIMEEKGSFLVVLPKLFEDWLSGPGLYQVVAQLEDKDEILDKVNQERKLYISDDELSEIATILDEIPNKQLPLLRSFIDQFEINSNKRLVSELLKKTAVITRTEMTDHMKKIKKLVWGVVELGLNEKDLRTDSEIFCFEDSYKQNKELGELMKSTFKFTHNKTIKRERDLKDLSTECKNLMIFEPLIDCQFYYRNIISLALKQINPVLARNLHIHIICFIITDEAKVAIEDLLTATFSFKFTIHYVRTTQRNDISPFINHNETINDATWKLLTSYDHQIDETSTLVKVGNVIPLQSIPLFWNGVKGKINPLFSSPFGKEQYNKRIELSKKLTELKFRSETNKLEFKATLSEPAINWKKIKTLVDEMISLTSEKAIEEKKVEITKVWNPKFPGAEKENLRKFVRHSLAKNLAAFGNTNGGEIYVGIEDDFTVQGIGPDLATYRNHEGIRAIFDSIVNDFIGKEFSQKFELSFIDLPGDILILKITIQKIESADRGLWLKIDSNGKRLLPGEEEFYVRGQQQANRLSVKEYQNWQNSFN